MFLNWIKTNNIFTLEIVFYNVKMKILRFGRQFQLMEDFLHKMISNGIELDNTTKSTIINYAEKYISFDRFIETFERMHKTSMMLG